MAYCGICGRHHDPATPCAVANRPAGGEKATGGDEARRLARRVDWILAGAVLAAFAILFFLVSR